MMVVVVGMVTAVSADDFFFDIDELPEILP